MLHRMRGLLVREGAVLTGDLTEPRLNPERSRQQHPIAGVLGAELVHAFGHEIADVPVLSTWLRGERTTP